jgi:DNA-binding MurR/RpiR family transcriptional regulator
MSTFNHDLFKTIAQAHSQLRKSERKVADYVLEHRAKIVQMRIVDLAAAAAVSEPTVVRFCRALDFEGFQDFKLKLAQFVGANTSSAKLRTISRIMLCSSVSMKSIFSPNSRKSMVLLMSCNDKCYYFAE